MEGGRDSGEVKETPSSVVNVSKSEVSREEKQQQVDMGKQNAEDLDEGAQEQMLDGDDTTAKITEKDNIEVTRDLIFIVEKIPSSLARNQPSLDIMIRKYNK